MQDLNTNWSEATQNPLKAVVDLVSCLQSGHSAYVTLMDNGKVSYPIQIKNPALNDHKNWSMSSGVPRDDEKLQSKKYFNDTERDLTLNYKYSFDLYRCEAGHLFEGKSTDNCPECGCSYKNTSQECQPVKLKNPKERTWIVNWSPKNNIPCWVPMPLKRRVFVVIHDKAKGKKSAWWARVLVFLAAPLKCIPKKSVLKMPEYINYSYRIGGVTNGYTIEFQIPKKFGF